MVRHQDELLVGMLTGDGHEGVQQLGVRGVCTHMSDIEKV